MSEQVNAFGIVDEATPPRTLKPTMGVKARTKEQGTVFQPKSCAPQHTHNFQNYSQQPKSFPSHSTNLTLLEIVKELHEDKKNIDQHNAFIESKCNARRNEERDRDFLETAEALAKPNG